MYYLNLIASAAKECENYILGKIMFAIINFSAFNDYCFYRMSSEFYSTIHILRLNSFEAINRAIKRV